MIQPIGHICTMYVWCICPMYIWCIFSTYTHIQIQDLGFIMLAIHIYSIQPPNLTLEPGKWVPNNLALDMAALAVVWCFLTSPNFSDVHGAYERNRFPSAPCSFWSDAFTSRLLRMALRIYAQLAGWGSPRGWGEFVSCGHQNWSTNGFGDFPWILQCEAPQL